jgi:CBS domain-containing protein
MTIRAILSNKGDTVFSISGAMTVRDAVAILADKRIGALPVVDDGAVRGIFSERDVIYGIAREGPGVLTAKVADVMVSPALTVTPDSSVMAALSLMTRRRVRHLPVVDGTEIRGFISIGDLVKYRIDRDRSRCGRDAGIYPDGLRRRHPRKSGGVASAWSIAIASSTDMIRCPSEPSVRIATLPSSASRMPTTSRCGTLASECSRTL